LIIRSQQFSKEVFVCRFQTTAAYGKNERH